MIDLSGYDQSYKECFIYGVFMFYLIRSGSFDPLKRVAYACNLLQTAGKDTLNSVLKDASHTTDRYSGKSI